MTAQRKQITSDDNVAASTRACLRWLVGICLLAFTARLIHFLQISASDPYFKQLPVDPRNYHEWAVSIVKGDWLGNGSGIFILSPLYAYVLAVFYKLFGIHIEAATAVQLFLSSFTCLLVYAVAVRLFDRPVALLAALLSALYPMSIFYDGMLMGTSLQVALNLMTLLALTSSSWGAAGVFLGLGALARPNVMLMAPAILFYLIWQAKERWKTALRPVATFCLGLGLVIAPMTLRNVIVADDFVLISGQAGLNLAIGNNPSSLGGFAIPQEFPNLAAADTPAKQKAFFKKTAQEAVGRPLKDSEVSSYWTSYALLFITEMPGIWLELLWKKAQLFFNHFEVYSSRPFYDAMEFSLVLRNPLLGFGVICPFALLGMALCLRRWRKYFFAFAFVGCYLLTAVMFFMADHYRMPVVPIFIIFAAYGVHWVYLKIRSSVIHAWIPIGVLVLLFCFVNSTTELQSNDRPEISKFSLGNAYFDQGKSELAIPRYREAIRDNPDYIPAYYNLALTLETRPEWRDKAIEGIQGV